MSQDPKPSSSPQAPVTLETVLAAVERKGGLSRARRRDLRSAVHRVADLLGGNPRTIALDLAAIGAQLSGVSPAAAGVTAKRLANIRSDFLAAVKASGLIPLAGRKALSRQWRELFRRLAGKGAHLGLSRLARCASAKGIEPRGINDETMADFIAAVRHGSLHRKPDALHRQAALSWNAAARDAALGLQPVTVPSFRAPPKRIDWALLPEPFRQDVDGYAAWCLNADPFAADARPKPLAPTTLRLRRDQIHAAVSTLVECGTPPDAVRSLGDLVSTEAMKSILRRRLEDAGGKTSSFNHGLGKALVEIARDWVEVDPAKLGKLKELLAKVPEPELRLTDKNLRFLRQFDDPGALQRLRGLPETLWAEVRRDHGHGFRTLAKAQAALAVGVLIYMPIRLRNLSSLAFDTHLFVRGGAGAISTLELSAEEVKNKVDLAFDIPPHVARMLLEYRDRIAPKIIGHRPARLFVNTDGSPKSPATVAWLIGSYTKRRAGIVLTPHQFRHLCAMIMLNDQPGAFETVKQLLGHKNLRTTVGAYTRIDSRRAGRHHQRLVDKAIAAQKPSRRRPRSAPKASRKRGG
jgi:integrase